jgi:hypothetical protein
MNKIRFVAFALFAFLFIGCPARSLSPLFEQKDARLYAPLDGTWLNNTQNQIYVFQPIGGRSYIAMIVDQKRDTIQYVVVAGQLGGQWFLDSYPKAPPGDHHVLSAHMFHRISIVGDTLTMASLESDWLEKMIDSKKISIPHARRDGEAILTASTEELQQLLTRFANDPEAFPKPEKLVREK